MSHFDDVYNQLTLQMKHMEKLQSEVNALRAELKVLANS
jgi:hypothetical protein